MKIENLSFGRWMMHEVSLMDGLLRDMEQVAREHGMARIFKIKLIVGTGRLVLPDAMQFAFEILKKDTAAGEAVLEMEERAGLELYVDYIEGE